MADVSKIKIDNGIYDIKDTTARNNFDIYTTYEKRIGTWINGKPLYRQTFSYQNLGTNQETQLLWNNSVWQNTVSDIDEITNYEAFYQRYDQSNNLDSFQQVPNVHSNMGMWGSGIFDLKPTGCTFWVGTLAGAFTVHLLNITIEYTKTTD